MLGESRNRFIVLLLTLLIASCARKSAVQEATGNVPVQVGVQTSATEYSLQKVTLKGISNLKEVSGAFAKFFYSPGSDGNQLVGSAPVASFIQTAGFFAPTDLISIQMATIYFHMQNLAGLDKSVGAENINKWPRVIGLETQIYDNNQLRRNNAFYNGETDAMMFVPFTGKELPIAMNAGIIAHEHFHSLFYKVVMRPAIQNKKIPPMSASVHHENVKVRGRGNRIVLSDGLSEKEKAELFNDTYLRGLNEGLADYWAWLYSNDPEFMRWSLPTAYQDRTLNLSANNVGGYETNSDITNTIEAMADGVEEGYSFLGGYIYKVGTPYGRFLKQLTSMQVENKKMLEADAKTQIAQIVFKYLQYLGLKASTLAQGKTLDASDLFSFVSQQLQSPLSTLKMDEKDCAFILQYINYEVANEKKVKVCTQTEAQTLMADQE